MFLHTLKANTNGQRWVTKYIKSCFRTRFNLLKNIYKPVSCGRNVSGQITTRHRKTAENRRVFNFNSNSFFSNTCLVISFNHVYKNRIPVMELIDCFRNIYIYKLIAGITYGDRITMFPKILYWETSDYLGTRTILNRLVSGTVFCNIKSQSNPKSLATSAGTYCSIISNDLESNLVKILAPSGKIVVVNSNYLCTIGRVGYEKFKLTNLGKAGNSCKLGWRSTVRGVAMNPVDHPHGGRTKTNSPERSPWGWIAKHNK